MNTENPVTLKELNINLNLTRINSKYEKVSVRAILSTVVGAERFYLLIRRQKKDDVYYVAVGGGVEANDSTIKSALAREVREEIDLDINTRDSVITETPSVVILEDGNKKKKIQIVYQVELDPDRARQSLVRYEHKKLEGGLAGPEYTQPGRGSYDLVMIAKDKIAELVINEQIKDWILKN